MKKPVFILLVFLVSLINYGQDSSAKKYYKDRYLHKETTPKKAKFELTSTQMGNKVEKQELIRVKNKKAIWIKYHKNDIPYGKWIFFDDSGNITKEFDYEFDLIYLPDSCFQKYNEPFEISNPNSDIDNIVYEMPMFKGGDIQLQRFLNMNIWYPKYARENGIQGKVYIRFDIEEDGKITNIKVLNGVHPTLDAEAVRIIRLMPNWTPGKMDGKVVKTVFNLPVRFVLQ